MAKPTKLSEDTVALARRQMEASVTAGELRRSLSVLLCADFGVTQAQAAATLGIGLATLKRHQESLNAQAHDRDTPRGERGGRHNETVSLQAEEAFLAQWAERAAEGAVVVVKQLREDLQRQMGRRVGLHTLYRMLARHGWRKVAPDTKHPQGDPVAQEAFKKTLPVCWRPPGNITRAA